MPWRTLQQQAESDAAVQHSETRQRLHARQQSLCAGGQIITRLHASLLKLGCFKLHLLPSLQVAASGTQTLLASQVSNQTQNAAVHKIQSVDSTRYQI
jgi:hypothetical protein